MLSEITWDTGMITMVMTFSVPIVFLLAKAWVDVQRSRDEAELKRSMVERGMSADEIERVIAVRSPQK